MIDTLKIFLVKALKSVYHIIDIAMDMPITLAFIPMFFVYRRFWVLLPITLFMDLLLGLFCYSTTYRDTLSVMKRKWLYDKKYTIMEDGDTIKALKEFHKKIHEQNNKTPYKEPYIIKVDLGNNFSADYTSFSFYDQSVVCIPNCIDISYYVDQAKLAHEMAHIATHFGAKQRKYQQIIIIAIYCTICLCTTLITGYWKGLFVIPIIVLYMWILKREWRVSTELEADNFALRWVQMNFDKSIMKEVASIFACAGVDRLMTRKKSDKYVELNRIKDMILYMTPEEREYLKEKVDNAVSERRLNKQKDGLTEIYRVLNCQEYNDACDKQQFSGSIGGTLCYLVLLALTLNSSSILFLGLTVQIGALWVIPVLFILIVIVFVRSNILCVSKDVFLESLIVK
ncbi:MAG: hypothetical protein IJE15_02385 [Bacteroidaceae bacterium]|nr:hypothetical protein [Bacteroidaceae bacterium]